MAHKPKSYTVDFTSLERRAGNYKALNPFEREIIDLAVSKSGSAANGLSPQQQSTLDRVYCAIEELTARQQEILQLSFGLGDEEPLTELQIAERLGITHQGVHDIKVRAITAIQKKLHPKTAAVQASKVSKK